MTKELFPKSNFRMKITVLERKDREDEKQGFRVVETKWVKGNGKNFRDSIYKDRKNKISRTIQIVNQEPVKFVFNQLYMLPTRDVVWVFIERRNEDV